MSQKINQKKYYIFILFTFLTWRIVLLFLGKVVDLFLPYDPTFPYAFSRLTLLNLPRWLYSWVNFDGVHYLTIASEGYLQAASVQAFFPIYPVILRIIWEVTRISFTVNGLVINTLFSIAFFIFWKKYVLIKQSEVIATKSYLIFLLFPTSFFLTALYSEALFLLVLILSFFAFQKRQFLFTGVLIAIASATRIVGIFLIPAFFLELYISQTKNVKSLFSLQYLVQSLKKHWKSYLYLCVGIIGLGSYMLYLYIHFHDPLYFFHVQSEFGAGRQEKIILLPQVIWRYIKIFWTVRPFDLKYFAYVQEFILSSVVGAVLVWGWLKRVKLKLTVSELTFSSLAFILPTLTGSFSSMPRYVLVCLPVFVIMSTYLKGWKFIALLLVSAFLLLLNSVLFLQGYWVA